MLFLNLYVSLLRSFLKSVITEINAITAAEPVIKREIKLNVIINPADTASRITVDKYFPWSFSFSSLSPIK